MVVKGQGLQRVRRTKSDAGHRTLPLPVFAVRMLERRRAAGGGTGPLFPDSRGGWRDPSNLSREPREARGSGEFAWVTSHVFRKTCATLLDRCETKIVHSSSIDLDGDQDRSRELGLLLRLDSNQ